MTGQVGFFITLILLKFMAEVVISLLINGRVCFTRAVPELMGEAVASTSTDKIASHNLYTFEMTELMANSVVFLEILKTEW